MKKVLVTGGAGFIGSFLVDELVKQGYKVRILDNLDPQVHIGGKKPSYLNREAEFILGDMRDIGAVHEAIKGVEIVCHLAGAVGVGQSQYEIARYVSANTQGTANLMDIIVNKRNKVEKILVAASMSSYGEGVYECKTHGKVRPPLRTEEQMKAGDWELHCPICGEYIKPVPTAEDAQCNLNSIYAFTKKSQEDICLLVGKLYRIPTVSVRFFNVYGPRQSLSNPYTGVAAIFMSRIKNGKPPVVYEDGNQTRDFISIHDVVRANIMAIENPKADYKAFNVGTGVPLKIADVARVIARVYGSEIEPEITGKYRKGDVRHCYADISFIKRTLGFTPEVSFEAGMKELIEWAQGAESIDLFDKARKELEEKGIA